MGETLVSIVIPTFNRAYCISRAIDSALGQTHQPVEVIVVDDGSTDGTQDLIFGAYSRDERVRCIRQKNKGVSAARNKGLGAVRGDYVAFLDSDDVWKPWKLEVQLACLEMHPEAGMIWSDMETLDPRGHLLDEKYLRKMYDAYRWFTDDQIFSESYPLAQVAPQLGEVVAGGTLFVGEIFSQMVMGNLVHTSTVLLRRDRLGKVKGFDEDLRVSGEDHDFHLRTCREGPVAFIDLATIQYQRGMPDRLSRHGLFTAQNFLKTVTDAIERDGGRIKLPAWMLDEVRAEANSWIAEQLAEAGDYRGARGHLAKSLAYKKWQPRVLALLALCSLSPGVSRALRRTYRAAKRPLRRADAR